MTKFKQPVILRMLTLIQPLLIRGPRNVMPHLDLDHFELHLLLIVMCPPPARLHLNPRQRTFKYITDNIS